MPYEYIKLHRSFFTGTMHVEAAYTKILFLAMLIECTDGVIVATNDYLCRFTNLKAEAVERALEALQLPDPNSTSIELQGRRIVAVENTRNTYRIVNWAKYQPALSSDWKEKPGLTVTDPDTGERVERLLPNGQKNPKYQKLYQRAYRAFMRERNAATAALEAELGTIGVKSVNSETSYGDGPKGDDLPVEAHTEDHHESAPVEPDHEAEAVNSVNFVNKRKVKETKGNNKNPLSPPRKPRKPAGSTKALQKGNSANTESFAAFDAIYPRPSNGRKLERSDARITWDLLIEAGEDVEAILEGCRRYRMWIEELRKHQYVAMMTTWLNNRRWEEAWYIDPNSDEGKAIAERKREALEAAKHSHSKEFAPAYEAFLESLAEKAIADPAFLQAWRTEAEDVLARRTRNGMTGAIKMAERTLNDPETSRLDQIRRWKDTNKDSIPTFWQWDREHNPKRFGA